jgi:hypothetical protein
MCHRRKVRGAATFHSLVLPRCIEMVDERFEQVFVAIRALCFWSRGIEMDDVACHSRFLSPHC